MHRSLLILFVCPCSGRRQIERLWEHMLDSAPWAISSVAERFLHTEEATGSIPVSPTTPSRTKIIIKSLVYFGAKRASFLDRNARVGYTSRYQGKDREII